MDYRIESTRLKPATTGTCQECGKTFSLAKAELTVNANGISRTVELCVGCFRMYLDAINSNEEYPYEQDPIE